MGEDDATNGKAQASLAKITEAHRATATLLALAPHDPDRIFAHAQSEYWVGDAAWNADDPASARLHFERYATLVRQLIAIDPGKKEWLIEGGDAESNLGTLALKAEKRPDLAYAAFKRALVFFEAALKLEPNDAVVLRLLADGHGWLADSARDLKRIDEAFAERLKQRTILEGLAAADPKNAKLALDLVGSSVGLARLEISLGRLDAAVARLRAAKLTVDALADRDPENQAVARQQGFVALRLADALLDQPRPEPAARDLIAAAAARCAAGKPPTGESEGKRLCEQIRGRE
jgi:tetratricopeptide (TPR) repeat protein